MVDRKLGSLKEQTNNEIKVWKWMFSKMELSFQAKLMMEACFKKNYKLVMV